MSKHESAAMSLGAWTPTTLDDQRLWYEYVEFAADAAHARKQTSSAQHLTVSAFVFNHELDHVVLCYHRKGRFWVQLGGHVEQSDSSLAAAAHREATEESGLPDLQPVGAGIVDLDRHALNSGFGTCEVHWDIGFAFATDLAHKPVSSDESDDVAWWPVASLPTGSVDHLAERIARISEALQHA